MNSGTQAAKEAGNMVDLDSNPTKLIEVVHIGKQMLMTVSYTHLDVYKRQVMHPAGGVKLAHGGINNWKTGLPALPGL